MFKTLRDMGAFPEDTDTVDDAYTGQLFRDKKAAMQLDGSWYAGNIEDTDNTVVIAFPGVPDQKAEAGSLVGGISSGFYITKKAWEDPDKRDAAVKFVMAHTCQAGVQRYWEATGAVSQAAVEVTPVEGATPFAQSIAEYRFQNRRCIQDTCGRDCQGIYRCYVGGRCHQRGTHIGAAVKSDTENSMTEGLCPAAPSFFVPKKQLFL